MFIDIYVHVLFFGSLNILFIIIIRPPDFVFSIESALYTEKLRQILRNAITPKIHKAGQTALSTAT